MKDNTYRNAINHLRFSKNLEEAVLEKANRKHPQYRIFRLVLTAAVLCVLLASTVFAEGNLIERAVRTRQVGTLKSDFSGAQVMNFTVSDDVKDMDAHDMELKPKGYYIFGEGLLYHSTEGFLRITEDYLIESVTDTALALQLDKNGRQYTRELRYVVVDGGIVDDYLGFYPAIGNTVLLNLSTEDGHSWPVYVNLETGECRDALLWLKETDFIPEDIPFGYETRVCGGEPFRGGIMISVLISGVKDGNSDGETLYYWLQKGTTEPVRMNMQDCHHAFLIDNTLFYTDEKGNYYEMDNLFCFRKIETIGVISDSMNQGLLTKENVDGTVDIYDLLNGEIYHVSGLNSDQPGYDATRNSPNGRIMLPHVYNDWDRMNRPVDRLAILDTDENLLRQITIDPRFHVQTHGWLDDDRYCVIYEEGLKRFLRVYEFTD